MTYEVMKELLMHLSVDIGNWRFDKMHRQHILDDLICQFVLLSQIALSHCCVPDVTRTSTSSRREQRNRQIAATRPPESSSVWRSVEEGGRDKLMKVELAKTTSDNEGGGGVKGPRSLRFTEFHCTWQTWSVT